VLFKYLWVVRRPIWSFTSTYQGHVGDRWGYWTIPPRCNVVNLLLNGDTPESANTIIYDYGGRLLALGKNENVNVDVKCNTNVNIF